MRNFQARRLHQLEQSEVHKPGAPIHPVVSFNNTPLYTHKKTVATYLKPLPLNSQRLKSSSHFKKTRIVPQPLLLLPHLRWFPIPLCLWNSLTFFVGESTSTTVSAHCRSFFWGECTCCTWWADCLSLLALCRSCFTGTARGRTL